MLRFLTTGGARFAYDADFGRGDYANLSFFAANRADILFHLSLRPRKGIAVTNLRRDGAWGQEQPVDAGFAEGVNRVEIALSEAGVTVDLNGTRLLETAPGDFPDLETVRFANWGGAIPEDSVEIGGPANAAREGMGALALTPGFALTGWAFDPASHHQRPAVEVEGLEAPLRCRVTADPARAREIGSPTDRLALRASLPGRVWRGADADGRVTLRAVSGAVPCGDPLVLTAEDILAQIETIAAEQAPEADSFAALTAIEHVGFGGLLDRLSPAARRYVLEAARLYDVLGWLLPEGAPEDAGAPEKADAAAAPGALLERRLRAELDVRLATDPEAGIAGTLTDLLERWPADAVTRQALVTALIEPACQSGRPDEVRQLARLVADLPLDAAAVGPWQGSLLLPLILLRSGPEGVAAAAQPWGGQSAGPVCPAALGWVLRELAKQETNPWEDRHTDGALRALMPSVERLARAYWRTPDAVLIDGAVALVEHRDRMSDGMALQMRDLALRCFGACPDFWARIEARAAAGALRIDGRIEAARAAFAVIEDETAGPQALDRALRAMAAAGVIEAPRLRLELLGPDGCADAAESGFDADIAQAATGLDPADLALRSLAFPGRGAGHQRLSETARQALAARWNNVDKAPYYGAQKRVAGGLHALLGRLAADGPDGTDTAAALDALLPALRKLAGQKSGYVGTGLLLVLIDALDQHGARPEAERVLAHLTRIRGEMPPDMVSGLVTAPAVRSGLAALERGERDRASAVREAALGLFPNRPPLTGLYPAAGAADLAEGAALFDTLVTVFSCRPYLDTRVPALREGWLRDLDTLGIPYVIVVGDGDGRREGDVLHLDAPDDYEGLPQKTLATVKWVFENTGFDHMLKIDDDCFLNVEEYFLSLSYRKADYYGRGLTRELGAMNRTWHHGKSRSDRARSEFDKSPEPSSYADGGGGYALSRRAMKALLEAAGTEEGWRLIDNSYMEDKLTGDLLALRGIRVSTEDYYTTICRRTHGDAQPILIWDNYFLPSAASPCKMAHLDTAAAQAPTRALAAAHVLRPPRLWPTPQSPGLGYNSNQLELLSDEETLFRLNKADLAVICVCRNEAARLPRFLDHYRALGVGCFLFVDNASDDGSRETLLAQPDCAVFSADTTYPAGRYGVTWQVTLMAQLRLGRWSLLADADELLVFPGWDGKRRNLSRFVSVQAENGADAFCVPMLDMYPQGALSDFAPGDDPFAAAGFTDRDPLRREGVYRGAFSNDVTRVSAVRHRLLPEARGLSFLAQKYALLRYRPWMRVSEGLHYAAQVQPGPEAFLFAHFKYDAGFAARVAEEAIRGQHFNGAEEYRLYAGLTGSAGALSFHDEAVSVPWRESAPARAILGG